MADIQPTLDLIDGALDDYLSEDAMRWTPEEGQRAEFRPEPGISQLRVGGIDLSEHVRSAMFAPIAHEEGTWREYLRELRPGSMTITGFFEWNADAQHPWRRHGTEGDWTAANPAAPEVSLQDDLNLMSSPETGAILDGWMGRLMQDLTPWQSRLLDEAMGYTLFGVPVYSSPLVPEGQILLYSPPRFDDVSFSVEPSMRFDEDLYGFRATMRMPTLGHHTHIALYDEASRFCSRHARLRWGRTKPKRLDPRISRMHSSYRRRSLARRRRNR